jgi:hypothetical protein
MPSSQSLGRGLLAGLFVLSLVACSSTPVSIGGSAAPSVPSSAVPASSSPAASPSAVATEDPGESVEPTANPEPTEAPILEPTPNPTPRPTQIAGCGTGEAGFAAHAGEGPRTLQFGGATIEFTPAGTGMRDGSYDVDDAIPGGVGLTANEIAVVVGPGDHIILRATGLTLVGTSAAASAWSRVTFSGGLAALGGPRTTLPWRVRPDGSLSISAPTGVGDWAVEFLPQWQSACVRGDGTAYARIKVR